MHRARCIVVLAALGLAGCSGVGFGDAIVGWAFAAGLVVLILVVVAVMANRGLAVGRRWLEGATVGRADLVSGAPASLTFTPRAGSEHALWLDLDTQGTAHRFDLTLGIQMDGGTFFEQTWPSGIESDTDADHFLILPPGGGAERYCFNVVNAGWRWRAVYRLMVLEPQTSSPVTVWTRLVPTGDTLVRRAHAVVTLGGRPP